MVQFITTQRNGAKFLSEGIVYTKHKENEVSCRGRVTPEGVNVEATQLHIHPPSPVKVSR